MLTHEYDTLSVLLFCLAVRWPPVTASCTIACTKLPILLVWTCWKSRFDTHVCIVDVVPKYNSSCCLQPQHEIGSITNQSLCLRHTCCLESLQAIGHWGLSRGIMRCPNNITQPLIMILLLLLSLLLTH